MADGVVLVLDPLSARIPLNGDPAPTKRLREGTHQRRGVLTFGKDLDTRYAYFEIPLPPATLLGTWGADIDLRLRWASAIASGNVKWGVAVARVAEDGTVDAAFGTEVEVTDSCAGANLENEVTATLTAALSPAPSGTKAERLVFRIHRISTSVSGNLDGDIDLLPCPAVLSLESRLDLDGRRYRRADFDSTQTLTRAGILGCYVEGRTDSGAVVLTLPNDMTNDDDGRVFPFFRNGANNLTIQAPSGHSIVGYPTVPLVFTTDNDSMLLMYRRNGNKWQVL